MTILTSGQLAKILRVASRTAAKLLDAGHIAGVYRLPGSENRRVPLDNVFAFLREQKMPLTAVTLFSSDRELAERVQSEMARGYASVGVARSIAELNTSLFERQDALLLIDVRMPDAQLVLSGRYGGMKTVLSAPGQPGLSVDFAPGALIERVVNLLLQSAPRSKKKAA